MQTKTVTVLQSETTVEALLCTLISTRSGVRRFTLTSITSGQCKPSYPSKAGHQTTLKPPFPYQLTVAITCESYHICDEWFFFCALSECVLLVIRSFLSCRLVIATGVKQPHQIRQVLSMNWNLLVRTFFLNCVYFSYVCHQSLTWVLSSSTHRIQLWFILFAINFIIAQVIVIHHKWARIPMLFSIIDSKQAVIVCLSDFHLVSFVSKFMDINCNVLDVCYLNYKLSHNINSGSFLLE